MQNKLLTKAAFILLAATLLQACGGGGGDSTTPSNNLANTTPVSSDPKPLSVVTELQPNIKNLSTDWPTGVTVGNDNTLTFAGSPQLAKGDIFVVNSTAYKVEGIGGTPSATQVIVSEPALNEVYKKIEFSGKSDALEFIPNPELGLQPVAVASENQGFQLGLGIKPSDAENKLTLSKNSDGFYTVKYAVEKGFKGFSVKGALTVGAKAEVSQWDVISNKGHGQFDIFVEPSLMVSLLKNENDLIDKSGICSSKRNLRGANYILLGTIPMSKALAAVPVAGAVLTSTVSMNIPVCLSMSASTDMNLDILQMSGKFQVSMFVGNQQAPHFNNSQSLSVSAPAATAMLSEATLLRLRYTAKAEGEMALEAGLELGDNLNLVNVGATAAAVVKASLEGDFGVSLLYKSLRGVIGEPDACLTVKGEGLIRAKGQTSVFWSKNPLSVVAETPLANIPDAQFGFCERTHLIVAPLSDNVSIGSTSQFIAEIVDDENRPVSTVPKLQWESSDPTVATVSATGLVTAIKEGSTKITVTDVTNMDKKKSATATVAVNLPIIGINAFQYRSRIYDLIAVGVTGVIWTSDNPKVTISNGRLTAAPDVEGTVIVTATDPSSGATGTKEFNFEAEFKVSISSGSYTNRRSAIKLPPEPNVNHLAPEYRFTMWSVNAQLNVIGPMNGVVYISGIDVRQVDCGSWTQGYSSYHSAFSCTRSESLPVSTDIVVKKVNKCSAESQYCQPSGMYVDAYKSENAKFGESRFYSTSLPPINIVDDLYFRGDDTNISMDFF